MTKIGSQRILYQSIIIGLVLLATWLRFWQLDTIPPGLWFDEAYNAMDAAWASDIGVWPVFLVGNNGREVLFHYLLVFFTPLFGETSYAIRLVSALLGILTIPVMYRWVLTIFGDRSNAHWLALIGAAGLVTSFWYLMMNRTAYRANLVPLFIIVLNYFFWRGWQTNRIGYYILAGAALERQWIDRPGRGGVRFLPELPLLVNNSYAFNFLYWRLHRLLQVGQPDFRWLWYLSLYNDDESWWVHQQQLLTIYEGAQSEQIPLIVVVFPSMDHPEETEVVTERVVNLFRERGAPTLDVADLIEGIPKKEVMASPVDAHPSELVHGLVADTLFEMFEEEGLVK